MHIRNFPSLQVSTLFSLALIVGCSTTSPSAQSSSPNATRHSIPASAAVQAAQPVGKAYGTTYLVYLNNQTTAHQIGSTMDITLDQVMANAPLEGEEAPSGYTVYGFEFTFRGVSGVSEGVIGNQMWPVGSDGQDYDVMGQTIAESPNDLAQGIFDVSSGKSETGWLGVDFPDGVKPASIGFEGGTLIRGVGNSGPTWTIKG
jgi:hypothetical protein